MFRRTTSALAMNGHPSGLGSMHGPFSRSLPEALLIAPDDSAAMATPGAFQLLREATGEQTGTGFALLPEALHTRLRELRHALLSSAAPVIALSDGLVCRACTLRGDDTEYLLIIMEASGRRDTAREQLDTYGFTPREHEVAALVTAGLSNRDIADRLCVTENTVESHIKRILTKAHVPSRAALVSRVLGGSPDGRP